MMIECDAMVQIRYTDTTAGRQSVLYGLARWQGNLYRVDQSMADYRDWTAWMYPKPLL